MVSRPPWLVGASAAGAPAFVPWAERALLFFPGHVPKLYINGVRYKLWRQVRNLDGVTAISGTLNCTVGAYAVCEGLANRSDAELKTHCAPFCEAMAKDAYRSQAANQPGVKQKAKFAAVAAGSASLLSVRKCPSRSRLHKECRPHRAVNWAAELPDMARAAVKLTQPEYFREAARHRFCLAAPGDFVSTPKITEFVAVGAAGGCLPLLVLDGPPANTLPYTRWLDYCEPRLPRQREHGRPRHGRHRRPTPHRHRRRGRRQARRARPRARRVRLACARARRPAVGARSHLCGGV